MLLATPASPVGDAGDSAYDIVQEVKRQGIGLLLMAASRYLADSALDYHAAAGLGEMQLIGLSTPRMHGVRQSRFRVAHCCSWGYRIRNKLRLSGSRYRLSDWRG